MTDILPTTWPAEDHTLAKHAILRRYLDAWIPILSQQAASVRGPSREILYLDGFAGPGEYQGGELGSPIIALQAALEHSRNFPLPVRFVFIEQREDRFQHLEEVLSRYEKEIRESRRVILDPPRQGDCDLLVSQMLAQLDQQRVRFGPALAFLDQFGYSAVSMDLVGQIMRYPQCEVFSYLDYRDMNRWIIDPAKAPAFTRTYGGEEWREAIALPEARRRAWLLSKYKEMLRQRAGVRYVQSFAMFDNRGVLLYWLLFCTNNLRGLEEMKKAMWSVDHSGKFRFSDKDEPGQLRLLEDEFDQQWLADFLDRELAERSMTVGEVKAFVLENSPCYLFKVALKELFDRGRIVVPGPPEKWRRGTFPQEEMVIQFGPRRLF